MQEEIFGPLLPILTYGHMRDVIKTINEKPHPLALYLFSESTKTIGAVTKQVSSAAAVSMTLSSIWQPVKWASVVLVPAEWGLITAKQALIHSHISKAS